MSRVRIQRVTGTAQPVRGVSTMNLRKLGVYHSVSVANHAFGALWKMESRGTSACPWHVLLAR